MYVSTITKFPIFKMAIRWLNYVESHVLCLVNYCNYSNLISSATVHLPIIFWRCPIIRIICRNRNCCLVTSMIKGLVCLSGRKHHDGFPFRDRSACVPTSSFCSHNAVVIAVRSFDQPKTTKFKSCINKWLSRNISISTREVFSSLA